MKISTKFQKFFFGVVCKELKTQAVKPMRYQNPFNQEWFLIDLNKVSSEGIYQLLKLINPYYPKLNNLLPASTRVLSNKHLTQHIQWIERWASENGITMFHVIEEWKKIIEEAR